LEIRDISRVSEAITAKGASNNGDVAKTSLHTHTHGCR